MGGLDKVANGVYSTNTPTKTSFLPGTPVINLDQGDPKIFEPYWRKLGDKCTTVIGGSEIMSYIADTGNTCWFLMPQMTDAIKHLHHVVGNAMTDDRHIVVGTGSSQLYLAALYALTTPGGPEPVAVVCAAPFYSVYPEATDMLQSRLFKWEGDAYAFDKEGPYIEIVTSPNNPDGTIRQAVVNRKNGKLIHDLAYYWPHYTPITHAADYDVMFFTFSKTTGHAGSRLGWAIVKDKEVAKKMVKFMELSSIGVSRESQLRAAKIIGVLTEGCPHFRENYFEHAQQLMAERWEKLRAVVRNSKIFTLLKYPQEFCNFMGKYTETYPAFAWLKCKEGVDCAGILEANNITTRAGKLSGAGPECTRISMISEDQVFDQFLERLSKIVEISNGDHMF